MGVRVYECDGLVVGETVRDRVTLCVLVGIKEVDVVGVYDPDCVCETVVLRVVVSDGVTENVGLHGVVYEKVGDVVCVGVRERVVVAESVPDCVADEVWASVKDGE